MSILLTDEEIDKAKDNGQKDYISRANRQAFTDAIIDSLGDCEDRAIAKAQDAKTKKKLVERIEKGGHSLYDGRYIDGKTWRAIKKEVEDG